MAEVSIETLVQAGYTSLDKLRAASDQELADNLLITPLRISELRQAINFLAPVVEEQMESSAVSKEVMEVSRKSEGDEVTSKKSDEAETEPEQENALD